jgi:hypothetical protein
MQAVAQLLQATLDPRTHKQGKIVLPISVTPALAVSTDVVQLKRN